MLLLMAIHIEKNNSNSYYWAFFIFLFFLAFFRAKSVGIDNGIYSMNFIYSTMNPSSWSAYTEFEPGFAWFTAFFKTYISQNYLLYMGVLYTVYALGVNHLFKRADDRLLCLFFWVLFLFYTQSFNIMRQYFALGLYFWYFPLLEKMDSHNKGNIKCLVLYVCLVFLTAFYVHRSLIVMSIIPLFIYCKHWRIFNDKKYLCGLVVASYIVIFANTLLYRLIPYFIGYFSFLGDRYVGYVSTSANAEVTISKISSLLDVAFAVYVLKLWPKDKLNNYLLQCYVFSVVLANLLGSFSDLFLRIAINLSFFKIFVFSYLWSNIISFKDKYYFRYFVVLYGLIIFIKALVKNFGSVVPYVNQFFV